MLSNEKSFCFGVQYQIMGGGPTNIIPEQHKGCEQVQTRTLPGANWSRVPMHSLWGEGRQISFHEQQQDVWK